MPFPSHFLAAGNSPQSVNSNFGGGATGLLATGSTAADALQLSNTFNTFTTASAGGAKLQPTEVGAWVVIRNDSGNTITVYPQRDARISHDLDAELRRMPGLLSWWIALRDEAEKLKDEALHEEHNTEEDLYEEYRGKAPKAATETSVKMAVKRDPRMRTAFRARMDAEHVHRRLKGAVEGIVEKRWSLQSLVKNAAVERGTKDHA